MRRPAPKFSFGDIIEFKNRIFLVLDCTSHGNSYYYRLIPVQNVNTDKSKYLYLNLIEEEMNAISDEHYELIKILFDIKV